MAKPNIDENKLKALESAMSRESEPDGTVSTWR